MQQAAPQSDVQNSPQKRGLYSRTEDNDIFHYLGKFGLITADELSVLSGRNVISLRRRLRQLFHADYIGRVQGGEQREEFFQEIICEKCKHPNKLEFTDGRIRPKPNFHFLLPKGAAQASSLVPYPIAWKSKAISRVDHDRVLSMIHLALANAFTAKLDSWKQMKQDVLQVVEMEIEESGKRELKTINFYPDAQASLRGESLWFEYANSEPSSENGVNDIVKKVERYNELMKDQDDGKVIFVFRERSMVHNFLNRIEEEFPYRWLYAVDLDVITTRPMEEIFFNPRDFDQRAHSLTERNGQ
jgi:hypothetical protein